jgi:hypothetical protein
MFLAQFKTKQSVKVVKPHTHSSHLEISSHFGSEILGYRVRKFGQAFINSKQDSLAQLKMIIPCSLER